MTDTDRPTILRLKAANARLRSALAWCVGLPFLVSFLLSRAPGAGWGCFAGACSAGAVAFVYAVKEGRYQ